MLVITIPKGKKEIVADALFRYDVTLYQSTLARGTMDKTMTKEVMFAIVKESRVKDAIYKVEDKMAIFKSKVSMVYAIPLHNIIGVQSYMSLINEGDKNGN